MKKSMLNVITLALVLINLVLTVLLTFSLVSTNNRTNNLIKKVGEIIDLDAAGNAAMAHRQEVLLILTILNMLKLKAVTAPI